MTFLTCLRLIDTYLPRLAVRLGVAWISGYTALHDLAAGDADPRDLPPPLF